MPFLKLRNRQCSAECAKVIQPRLGAGPMAGRHRPFRDTSFAVLQIVRAYASDKPLSLHQGAVTIIGQSNLDLRQGSLRCQLIRWAPDSFAIVVEEGHSLLRSGQRVVPSIGLIPMPSGTMLLAACLSLSSHANPPLSRVC